MIRKIFLVIGLILVILVIANYSLVVYGIKQGIGQLNIVWEATEIEDVLHDPAVPDSVKIKLSLIREVISFGVEEISLEDNGNYQTYYDQKGKPLLFVVTAAEEFALVPYEWDFPVVGAMPYKGYFNERDAEVEKKRMIELGYDAYTRTPGGWSTLGWFKDPVLSNMLLRNEGDLANVILHELTHSTIFIKDSAELNENLATFIGDQATELFLLKKYGLESEEWNIYHEESEDFEKFVAHILKGADKLDSLYNNISSFPVVVKNDYKEKLIANIIESLDTISFHHPENYKWKKDVLPNNAYFMSFLRYRSKQTKFREQLEKDFNNNLRLFVKFLSEKYDK